MIALYILLGLLLLILLIIVLPVGLSAIYQEQGLEIDVHIGFLRFRLDRDRARFQEKIIPVLKREAKTFTKQAKAKIQSESGGKLSDFLPLLDALLKLLGDLRRKIRVRQLDMNLILAGDDASNLALSYGKAWVAVGNLLPLLEKIFVIRKRNVQVSCDFVGDQTRIYTRLSVTMPFGKLMNLLVKYGIPLCREYDNFLNSNEGGTENG